MAEVQAHGNKFEDLIIKERTGMTKKDYDNLKANGYTSPFDIVKGYCVDYNASVKTTGSNTICCGDLLRMMQHREHRLIVGCYTQEGKKKVFHTQYEFYIQPSDYKKLWGQMDYQKVEQFVEYVKNIPHGKEAQLSTKSERNQLQEQTQCNEALYSINPKVDSKKQRRVQCSLKLDELIDSGVYYEKKELDMVIQSSRRNFNK